MANSRPNSPLVGYNTNVKHDEVVFHIQTEDSGVGHPHVITHLFTEGTILSSKKTSYSHLLEEENFEEGVRQLMKEQHKAMFIELRDGVHDKIAARILGQQIGDATPDGSIMPPPQPDVPPVPQAPQDVVVDTEGVRVIKPVGMSGEASKVRVPTVADNGDAPVAAGRSIFDPPEADGQFGEDLITDKSLDEVILSYLTDDLDD